MHTSLSMGYGFASRRMYKVDPCIVHLYSILHQVFELGRKALVFCSTVVVGNPLIPLNQPSWVVVYGSSGSFVSSVRNHCWMPFTMVHVRSATLDAL
jgi:hypothetical protein